MHLAPLQFAPGDGFQNNRGFINKRIKLNPQFAVAPKTGGLLLCL